MILEEILDPTDLAVMPLARSVGSSGLRSVVLELLDGELGLVFVVWLLLLVAFRMLEEDEEEEGVVVLPLLDVRFDVGIGDDDGIVLINLYSFVSMLILNQMQMIAMYVDVGSFSKVASSRV